MIGQSVTLFEETWVEPNTYLAGSPVKSIAGLEVYRLVTELTGFGLNVILVAQSFLTSNSKFERRVPGTLLLS